MRQYIDSKSEQEGRLESRLPVFDADWQAQLKGNLLFQSLKIANNFYILYILISILQRLKVHWISLASIITRQN